MPIREIYIDTDVYTEAKKRIRKILLAFDTLIVSFSGGKDSLVVLKLVEEVYKEMGIKEKVKVAFLDEELIPDYVVDFVREMYESGRYDFRWYAYPLESNKFVMGDTKMYVQWDRNRKWLRQPPPFAIRPAEDDTRVYSQYMMHEVIARGEKGRVASLLGIRAEESLMRRNSCKVKLNENYICASNHPRVFQVKPIYDWSETDVFLYFYKNGITYCPLYDLQMWAGERLRVSTPLHSQNAKNLDKLKITCPVFYQQIIDLFPEMKLNERYYKQMYAGRDAVIEKYPRTFEGVIQFCHDTYEDPVIRAKMEKALRSAWKTREEKMKTARGREILGGFPLRYMFRAVMIGEYKNGLTPMHKNRLSKLDFDFENE
jgi:predicted phosphoadenosine phosphosulfate sulfurtransferase